MDIKLSDVRISFPTLFKPESFQGGEAKYSAAFLVKKGSANDKAIRAAITEEAKLKFGKKAESNVEVWKSNSQKCSYVDATSVKNYDDEFEDYIVLTSKSSTRPLVIDRDRSPLTADDGVVYSGCYVNAKVSIYAQGGEFSGIRSGLMGVQFSKDGEAFGGGRRASEDDFDDISEGSDADDLV